MLSAASLIAVAALAAGPDTLTLMGPDGAMGFGHAIAAAGDIDGDGRGDLLVGMPRYSGTFEEEGWVGLYLGKSVGIETTPAWTMTGGQAFAHFGHAVAGLGDVDGDGRFDFAVGAPGFSRGAEHEGIVYVWLGLPSDNTQADWSIEGVEVDARLGSNIAGVGDVNDDGYADLLIGAPGLGAQGRVQLHLGEPNGPTGYVAWFVDGAGLGTEPIGHRIAGALDTDGDGFSDFAIHTPTRTLLFLGAEDIARTPDATLAPSTASLGDLDDSGQTALVANLTAAGDLNGDSYADALALDHPSGRVALLAGSPTGLLPTPIRAGDCDCAPGPRTVIAAGDLDGDGMADVAIGAPDVSKIEIWRGGWSGLSSTPDWVAPGYQIVASAGDVNGDGFGDLIAASVADAAEYPDAGDRAGLFLGSDLGFTAPPSIFSQEFRRGFDDSPYASLISPAGDVDGDGFSDVLVGFDRHESPTDALAGKVFLLWGSPMGLLQFDSHRPPFVTHGNPAERIGYRLTGAGDVDGDGLSDFLVGGMPNGRGSVRLFLGTPTGPREVWRITGESPTDRLLATFAAGDLDGDGTSDFSIDDWILANGRNGSLYLGAHGTTSPRRVDNSAFDERAQFRIGVGDVDADGRADLVLADAEYEGRSGKVVLYRGSPGDGVDTRIWSALGEPGTGLGYSVAPAGDVNADGFADFAVNADWFSASTPASGKVRLYLGGPDGPGDSAEWVFEGDAAYTSVGDTMAADDFNGDGFSDLALGVWRGNSVRSPEPKVRVFYGNHGLGFGPAWRSNVHLRDLITSAQIHPGGRANSAFGAYLVGTLRSTFGRFRTAFEVEVKPFDEPFDGRGTQLTPFSPTAHAPRTVYHPIDDLETDRAYHWRVRLRYDPTQNPPQLGSHWVLGGHPGQLSAVHFRTGRNHAPTVEDAVFLGLDASIGASRNAPGLLAYARDEDYRDELTAAKVDGPTSGTATVSADGTFFYKPDPGFSGIDRFRWRATDPFGASAIGTVTLHVEPGGVCSAISLTQCGRGRTGGVLQTVDGPKGFRCGVVQTSDGPRLECDTDSDGTLRLRDLGAETCRVGP